MKYVEAESVARPGEPSVVQMRDFLLFPCMESEVQFPTVEVQYVETAGRMSIKC